MRYSLLNNYWQLIYSNKVHMNSRSWWKRRLFTRNYRVNSLDSCFWKATYCQPSCKQLAEGHCPHHANRDLTMTSSGNLAQQMEPLLNLSDFLSNVQDFQTESCCLWVTSSNSVNDVLYCPQQPLMHWMRSAGLHLKREICACYSFITQISLRKTDCTTAEKLIG